MKMREGLATGTNKNAVFTAIVCAVLFVVIVYSFVVRIQMYRLGITLWEDEARLAESILTRTMKELLTPPLINRQTAPVLYLVFVKALTLLFGTAEAVLRAPSFIAMVGLLFAQGFVLRKIFNVRMLYTLFSVTLSSIFLYYMQHSNELKPYVGDALFVLCVLLVYYAYREGLLGRGIRGALLSAGLFVVIMLSSTPAIFAIAAVLIVEFLAKCRRRDRQAILMIVLCGAIFIVAFAANYFLWLKPIADNPQMQGSWDLYKFRFDMFGREAILHNYYLLRNLFDPILQKSWFLLPLAAAGFVISLVKRSIYSLVVAVFVLLLLIVSAFGLYPVANRLWLFIFAIIFIYCFILIDALRIKIGAGKVAKAAQVFIPVLLAFILLAPNFSFPAFGRGEEWTLTPGDQAKPLIKYVRENIKDDELLYSYHVANKILRYENGYDADSIGSASDGNIVYGTLNFDEDIDMVAEADIDGAYVLYYHSFIELSRDWQLDYTIAEFQKHGYMDPVMDVYHSMLYWFTTDLDNVRAAAELEIDDLNAEGGTVSGRFHVRNTGETILAHDRFDYYGQLYILLREAGKEPPRDGTLDGVILGAVKTPLMPGESRSFSVEKTGIPPGEYQIELVAIEEYYFSELGLAPIPVTVGGPAPAVVSGQ